MLWPNYRRWASQGCLGVMRSYSHLRASEWAPTQLFLTFNIVNSCQTHWVLHTNNSHFLAATLYTRLLGAGSQ
jgi:hypothetical protein